MKTAAWTLRGGKDDKVGHATNETEQMKHFAQTNETFPTNETMKIFPEVFHLLTMFHLFTFEIVCLLAASLFMWDNK